MNFVISFNLFGVLETLLLPRCILGEDANKIHMGSVLIELVNQLACLCRGDAQPFGILLMCHLAGGQVSVRVPFLNLLVPECCSWGIVREGMVTGVGGFVGLCGPFVLARALHLRFGASDPMGQQDPPLRRVSG